MLAYAMSAFMPGSTLTPDDLDQLSLENLYKALRYRTDREGDALYEFTPRELDVLGFRSRQEVLDCLSDVLGKSVV